LRLDPDRVKKEEIPQKYKKKYIVNGKNFVQIALDLHNFKCWLIGLCLFPQRIRQKKKWARKLGESE